MTLHDDGRDELHQSQSRISSPVMTTPLSVSSRESSSREDSLRGNSFSDEEIGRISEDDHKRSFVILHNAERSKSRRIRLPTIIATCTCVGLFILIWGWTITSDKAPYYRDVLRSGLKSLSMKSLEGYMNKDTYDNVYKEDASQYFKDVRLDNPDGLAYAQMGFRTRLYAKMLRHEKNQDSKHFKEMEEAMWFFVPGIKEIRQRAQSVITVGKVKKATRGIVMSVDKSRFVFACHFLAMLRSSHQSTLPVEIFYLGDDDLPQSMRDHLVFQYNVAVIDLATVGLFDNSYAKMGGYAIKPFALLATSFSEVLMSDADSVLLTSPDSFFDQEGYKQDGTLFFQDRETTHTSEGGHNFIVEQLGNRNVSERLANSAFWKHSLKHWQESGIVVVNRKRPEVLSSLLFAAWQNGLRSRDTVHDRHFWGDKESYWLAFELAGLPYYMVNHSCGAIGQEHFYNAAQNTGFCSEHPLHFFDAQKGDKGNLVDPKDHTKVLGKPAWFNGSLRSNKNFLDLINLDPTYDTIFAMDGKWTMYDGKGWCLTDYKRFGLHEYHLDVILGKLLQASREGERLTKSVMV